MDELKVTIVQTNLVWENAIQNRMNLEDNISKMEETDLIVLPEMFTTGFSMYPKPLAEKMDGDTVHWLQQIAKKKNAAIAGSIIIEEKNQYYNRFLFVTPQGLVKSYDKRHLFTLAGEHEQYQRGEDQIIIEYKGWKIKPQICYDLRFPVWSRNTTLYDVLIYVANWPKPRIEAWNTLLKARAIENMVYTIGVNRIGLDPNNNEYTGSSRIYDGLGQQMSINNEAVAFEETVTLQKSYQEKIRKKFNFLNDRDHFEIN